jgi:ribonuclease HII
VGALLAEPDRADDRSAGTVLGIDEAGRGSLVGPLVVGGYLCDRSHLSGLPGLGACDSKTISPGRRSEVYERLRAAGRSFSVALSPALVDRYTRRGRLNELEARAFARLVRRARPSEAFVDACDPNAARFGETVRRLAGAEVPVRASHHADRDLAVVGAASIIAKVRRDRAIARLARAIGPGVGSGYPSDPRTVEFVRATLARGGPPPAWLRASWATTGRLKRELSVIALERFAP